MSTSDDLAETARLVKEAGSEMVAVESDVRDQEQVDAAFRAGPQSFGRVDIVLGNAGILHDFKRTWLLEEDEFRNVLDVNILG